jgi:hypothetical protein
LLLGQRRGSHQVLLEKVFPRQATITTAAGVAQAIGVEQ